MTFKLRDKVMQMTNNYDKEIFNGDIEWVSSIDQPENREIIIDFDGRLIPYGSSELGEIVLAYAISVRQIPGERISGSHSAINDPTLPSSPEESDLHGNYKG